MRLRRIAIGVAAIAAMAAVALVVVLKSIDWSRYSSAAAARVKAATGRDFVIAGRIDVQIFPALAVTVENASFGNVPWGSRREMAKVRRAAIELALLPLLTGEIRIDSIALDGLDVLLETDARGRNNWTFGAAGAAPGPDQRDATDWRALDLDGLRIERAVLTYRDGKTRQTHRVHADEIRLTSELLTRNLKFDATGSFDGRTVSINLKTGPLRALLAAESRFPLEVAAKIGGKGTQAPLSIAFAGDVAHTPQQYAVDNLKAQFGPSTFEGRAGLDLGRERPAATARLAAGTLDLTEALAPRAKTKTPDRDAKRIFPDDPLPLDALRAADADVEIRADKVLLPGNRALGALRARAALNRGRFDLNPLQFDAGGAPLTMRLMVDAYPRNAAAVMASVAGKAVSLGHLLSLFGETREISGGKTDISIDAQSSGGSVRALMAALNGNARIVVGTARLRGTRIDIGGDILTGIFDAVTPRNRQDDSTDLKCAVVRIPVARGVARIERSIALETAKVAVVAAGTINLADESLDIAVRPRAKEGLGIGAGDLASLVKVTGTLAEPALGVDAVGVAQQAAKIGAAVATGGMSLLGGILLDKATSDDVCAAALAAVTAKSGSAPAQTEQSGGFFERLFGK